MLDKEKGIDGVTVSTPDHTHAVAALAAMVRGKHVYCQKPLTHTIYEARMMTLAARQYKVATQMGNQAHAGEPIRRAVELVRAGVIGPAARCIAGPIDPSGLKQTRHSRSARNLPAKANRLAWNGTCGWGRAESRLQRLLCTIQVARLVGLRHRRAGDMACHIMDMPYWALDLGSPESVEAQSGGASSETGRLVDDYLSIPRAAKCGWRKEWRQCRSQVNGGTARCEVCLVRRSARQ